eukprot:3058417-Amphidinium_carterae.1
MSAHSNPDPICIDHHNIVSSHIVTVQELNCVKEVTQNFLLQHKPIKNSSIVTLLRKRFLHRRVPLLDCVKEVTQNCTSGPPLHLKLNNSDSVHIVTTSILVQLKPFLLRKVLKHCDMDVINKKDTSQAVCQ